MASLLDDPLDSEDFDPVQYINQIFPTESSLDDLDNFVVTIGAQISALDDEISKAVQNQSVIGRQVTKDIHEAQENIEELFNKIQDIKLKASQSESMVQDLCVDIKKLDNAKNHLQTSITSLNRLQMLINAVNQLELLANDHQYKEVANLMDAVKQFISHFDKYKHIPVISDLNKRIERIRQGLISHIRTIFREVAEKIDTVADAEVLLADLPGGLRTLADACSVIDALGHSVRREFFEDFVRSQLVAYDNLFGHGKQHFALDQVERRWAWFKRLLKYIDAKFVSIFPPHWRLPLRLCLEFVERTKMHLILMLTEVESAETGDVQMLVKALQSALRFEQEMAEHFHLLHELKHSKEIEELAARQRTNELETQKRLKRESKLMYIPTDHDAENKEEESESGFLGLAHTAISGGISGVFDKFLGSYVTFVRQNLDDALQRLVQEEEAHGPVGGAGAGSSVDGESGTARVEGHNGSVYGSATGMFVFIKNAIKQCIALSNGHTFLLLSEEFQQAMQNYASVLRARCPTESSLQPLGFRLAPGTELTVCLVINTGEYCAEVAPQLRQMICAKIVPSLANKVDFAEEEDQFLDLVAHGVKVLVFGLLDRMEPGFRALTAMNWGAFTNVGEESAYLHLFNNVLLDALPKIKTALSSSYFQNFCTKLAAEILVRFQDGLVRAKRISDMATQQLLLDTYSLKTLLLALPALSTTEAVSKAPAPNPVYAKLINGKAAHIEVMLKLIGTPEEMLVERFRMLWPDGQATDLQMLMALKGTKRNDQQALLEMLGLATASKGGKGSAASSSSTALASAASAGAGASGGHNAMAQASSAASQFAANTAASTAAASAAAFSSMKSLTQDLSSQAKSAMTNLKWPNRTQNQGQQF